MAQATYHGEDFSVIFEGPLERVHNPDGYGVFDVSIVSLEFLGLDMPIEHIPDNVYDALLEYARECEDWE